MPSASTHRPSSSHIGRPSFRWWWKNWCGPSPAPAPTATAGGAAPKRSVVIGPDGVVHVRPTSARPPARPARAKRSAKTGRRAAKRTAVPAGPGTNAGRPPQNQSPQQAAAGAYRAAKQQLDGGQLRAARDAFTAFLRDHPDHPLADNALYWMAETWYAQSLWLRAARVFGQVVARYPGGNKVPDAMLKTALCYKNLGETRLARDTLAQLVSLYPGTNAASIGRRQLQRLGNQGSKP